MGEDDKDEVADRRSARRTRTLKKGEICFLDNYTAMGCVVLDISETGARLRPADVKSVPDKFRLRGPDGTLRLCELVWRDSQKIGVRFL